MKLWRITDPIWSSHQAVVNGAGAFQSPGRWNNLHVHACYCGENLETAVAEKGNYVVRARLLRYIKTSDAHEKKHIRQDLENLKLVCSVLNVSDSVNFEDLTTQVAVDAHLNAAALSPQALQSGRLSPFHFLPERWTQKLGTHLQTSGKIGAKFLSARTDAGGVHVLYPLNLKPGDVSIEEQFEIDLFPIPKGKSAQWSSNPDPNFVGYSMNGILERAAVLHFSAPQTLGPK